MAKKKRRAVGTSKPAEDPAGARQALFRARVGFIPFLVAIGFLAAFQPIPHGFRWLGIMGCFLALFVIVGYSKHRKLSGIIINERNVMSVARLQVVLWSILLLSGMTTFFSVRFFGGAAQPFEIELEPNLLWLSGISVASYVGARGINGPKTRVRLTRPEIKRNAKDLLKEKRQSYEESYREEEHGGNPNVKLNEEAFVNWTADQIEKASRGSLFGNTDPKYADVSDLVEGDEIGTTAYTDIAKVQMLFFTFVAVGAYAFVLFSAFQSAKLPDCLSLEPPCLPGFPRASAGLVEFMVLSHLGYLGNKFPSHK